MRYSPHDFVKVFGGAVTGRDTCNIPAPGHGPTNRALSIKCVDNARGYILFCHNPDVSDTECLEHVDAGMAIQPSRRSRFQEAPCHREPDEQYHRAINAERSALARRVFDDAGDARGTLAERYLRNRGLEIPEAGADVIRFHPTCIWHKQTLPCLVALYRRIDDNAPQSIVRIALSPDGTKLDRMMLGPTRGCAIKVDADENVHEGLIVGEGLETVLAGRQLGYRPAWALGSAQAIANFAILNGIEALTILGENDSASQQAIEKCGANWHAAGKEVFIVEPMNSAHSDVNDVISGCGA